MLQGPPYRSHAAIPYLSSDRYPRSSLKSPALKLYVCVHDERVRREGVCVRVPECMCVCACVHVSCCCATRTLVCSTRGSESRARNVMAGGGHARVARERAIAIAPRELGTCICSKNCLTPVVGHGARAKQTHAGQHAATARVYSRTSVPLVGSAIRTYSNCQRRRARSGARTISVAARALFSSAAGIADCHHRASRRRPRRRQRRQGRAERTGREAGGWALLRVRGGLGACVRVPVCVCVCATVRVPVCVCVCVCCRGRFERGVFQVLSAYS